jgi:CRP-like cAMP-binding protein/predicted MFS family arabinose efflux permease
MWSGQLISTAGSSLTSLAASMLVFRLTGSALSVGLMLISSTAPGILIGLVAGVLVDRYDRRKILIATDLLRAGLVFLIPFLVPVHIAWLYIIISLSSTAGQFFYPAHESLLPEVASDQELAAANSFIAISSFGSTAIGFAASGLIASRFHIEWAFYLNALTFLISGLCTFLVHTQPVEMDESTSRRAGASPALVAQNLKAGLRYLFNTPILHSLFFLSIPVLIAFGLQSSLMLPFTLRALQAGEFEFGLQESLSSVGFVAGSLLMASLADRLREGQWLAISFVGMGLAGAAYALSTSMPAAIAILMISGFLNAPSAVARRLVVQRNTPREMRGRVNSGMQGARDLLYLIGMSAAGLADLIDVRSLYLFSALFVILGGAWTLFLPGLRQAAAEWRRALRLLRTAPARLGPGVVRPAIPADLDLLAGLLPSLSLLSASERENLVTQATVSEMPAETTIIHHGETGDTAYFILAGQAAAGIAAPNGDYRSLSTMQPGDFFGEIAALTGSPRTATVVATEPVTLFQVPAQSLRRLMSNPDLSQLFLSTMTERLVRTSLSDLPRFAGYDQQALRELRTRYPADQGSD